MKDDEFHLGSGIRCGHWGLCQHILPDVYRIRTLDNKWFTFLELMSVMGITEVEIIINYLNHSSALKD